MKQTCLPIWILKPLPGFQKYTDTTVFNVYHCVKERPRPSDFGEHNIIVVTPKPRFVKISDLYVSWGNYKRANLCESVITLNGRHIRRKIDIIRFVGSIIIICRKLTCNASEGHHIRTTNRGRGHRADFNGVPFFADSIAIMVSRANRKRCSTAESALWRCLRATGWCRPTNYRNRCWGVLCVECYATT